CGTEDIIVTYPRQGFKFNAISIHETYENQDEYKKEHENMLENNTIPPLGSKHPGIRRSLQRLIMIMAACLVPFSAVVLYQNSTRINIY
ncbi:transcriptional regulator CadC, partial [Serratia nevei]